METPQTAYRISNDVNKAIMNHFMYGWTITDKDMGMYFAMYDDCEWEYFQSLWNKRSQMINRGVERLN